MGFSQNCHFFVGETNISFLLLTFVPSKHVAAKPESEKGMIAKLGLDDWKFALPVGLFIGIPTIANEVSILLHYFLVYTNINFPQPFLTHQSLHISLSRSWSSRQSLNWSPASFSFAPPCTPRQAAWWRSPWTNIETMSTLR